MIVAFDAGGGTDANARIVSTLLERELGQPVNVVNRSGGSGVVGHTAVATAPPDGYTLGYITVEVAMMHWAGLSDLTYRDFTPLAMVSGTAGSLLVRADAPYASMTDLLAAIQHRPDAMKASGSGQGGIWHVALAGLLQAVDLDPSAMTWIPHQGAAPALADLVAGGIDVVVCAPAEARALLDAGRVRALAVLDHQRHPLTPGVPTLDEAVGVEYALVAWGGIAGPVGLPTDVTTRLTTALARVVGLDEFRQLLEARGTGVIYKDGPAFAEYMAGSDAGFEMPMVALGLAR